MSGSLTIALVADSGFCPIILFMALILLQQQRCGDISAHIKN
ncbi:MAG TPA: hypothetical protein VI278_17970 [Nitrososphaeraceae archaeon]